MIGPKGAKVGSDAGEAKRAGGGVLELGNVKALERDPKGSGGDRLDADFWAGKGGGGGGGGDAGGEVRVVSPGEAEVWAISVLRSFLLKCAVSTVCISTTRIIRAASLYRKDPPVGAVTRRYRYECRLCVCFFFLLSQYAVYSPM